MSGQKSIKDYYMNLNGYAYDPLEKDGGYYIRVANLNDPNQVAVFCVANKNSINLCSSTISSLDIAKVTNDLMRNVDLILEGLNYA